MYRVIVTVDGSTNEMCVPTKESAFKLVTDEIKFLSAFNFDFSVDIFDYTGDKPRCLFTSGYFTD